jgi:predicted RNase H-like HicB family nuclease
MVYTVVLVREEVGGYSVSVPALDGCHTQGDSLAEALDMAKEAILAYADGEHELGKTMPPDVEEFVMGVKEAAEALVLKVTVPLEEAAPVA